MSWLNWQSHCCCCCHTRLEQHGKLTTASARLAFPRHTLIFHSQVYTSALQKRNLVILLGIPATWQPTSCLCTGPQVCVSIQEAVEELKKPLSATYHEASSSNHLVQHPEAEGSYAVLALKKANSCPQEDLRSSNLLGKICSYHQHRPLSSFFFYYGK